MQCVSIQRCVTCNSHYISKSYVDSKNDDDDDEDDDDYNILTTDLRH